MDDILVLNKRGVQPDAVDEDYPSPSPGPGLSSTPSAESLNGLVAGDHCARGLGGGVGIRADRRHALTPAILFVVIGVLVGPKVLGEVDLSSSGSTVRALAEATLALVLFSDASRINLERCAATRTFRCGCSASACH